MTGARLPPARLPRARTAAWLVLAGLTLVAPACRTSAPAREPDPPPPTADIPLGRDQNPEQALARFAERFLADFFAAAPVSATSYGDHTHDDHWPDLSPSRREDEALWLADQLDAAAAIRREALPPHARVELDTIRDQLELWQFSLEVERPWQRDPLAYSTLISMGLDDLISREFAPLDARAQSVAARLEGLPTLVDQAIANLADPAIVMRPQAEVAIAQLAGCKTLIESEIPTRTTAASAKLRKRIADASPPALAAVERLRIHVEALAPKAEGAWRIGADAFARKLALTLQSDLSADELLELAWAEHARVRGEMFELARELYAAMYGARALERWEKTGRVPDPDELVRKVLAELAADHPKPEQLRDAAEANLARLDQFVRDQKLVPIDPDEVLEVIWTPEHARGVAIAGLAAPTPLNAATEGLPSFYLVQPLPDSWSEALRESFLREYNSFMLEILSIHEAIPGHFVQLYWGKREPSAVRRVFGNGAFVEGWAVYTERVLVEAGYAGAPPALDARPKSTSEALWTVQQSDALRAKAIRLHGLKFYLRTVTNAILDHEIHAGDMTRDEALALMVERSFQERGEAEGKWTRAQITSTQLSTYFVGATAWFRLRERAEARARAAGEAFDLLGFHAEALAHGAPPVHRLPELMGWD